MINEFLGLKTFHKSCFQYKKKDIYRRNRKKIFIEVIADGIENTVEIVAEI